jgi:hypothetical protein
MKHVLLYVILIVMAGLSIWDESVICVGDDGHVSIEPVWHDHCAEHRDEDKDGASSDHCHECQDTALSLLNVKQKSRRSISEFPPILAICCDDHFLSLECTAMTMTERYCCLQVKPPGSMLATTILII